MDLIRSAIDHLESLAHHVREVFTTTAPASVKSALESMHVVQLDHERRLAALEAEHAPASEAVPGIKVIEPKTGGNEQPNG